MKAETWLRMRLVLIGIFFIGGSLSFLVPDLFTFPDLPPTMMWLPIGFLVTCIALSPIMVAAVISFQVLNPFTDKTWTRPTHSSNPLRLRNPLLFFHFASYLCMAQGLGMALTSFLGGWVQLMWGLQGLAGGLGCLAGVHLAMRWCKHKMA
jgi:hypothetical protein